MELPCVFPKRLAIDRDFLTLAQHQTAQILAIQFDALYTKVTGKAGSTNVYAAMTYDMAIVLALAIEAAGPGATVAQVNAKIREVGNPGGTPVFTFAEGKALLARKQKINYEGASSKLDFDKYGDVTPDFGVFVIEKGQLVRRDVVSIPAGA